MATVLIRVRVEVRIQVRFGFRSEIWIVGLCNFKSAQRIFANCADWQIAHNIGSATHKGVADSCSSRVTVRASESLAFWRPATAVSWQLNEHRRRPCWSCDGEALSRERCRCDPSWPTRRQAAVWCACPSSTQASILRFRVAIKYLGDYRTGRRTVRLAGCRNGLHPPGRVSAHSHWDQHVT